MHKVSSEREGFRMRLHEALRNAHYSTESPTELARDFNARFTGRPVTVHAARKWLVGEAIPTQDKMRTLAQWLGVGVEWLRFGGEEQSEQAARNDTSMPQEDLKLASDLRLLNSQDRLIVREIVKVLLRATR